MGEKSNKNPGLTPEEKQLPFITLPFTNEDVEHEIIINANNASTPIVQILPNEKIETGLLAKLLSEFTGNPVHLQNFLSNAENALSLAHPSQKTIITALIFAKVSPEVKAKINASEIESFFELKNKLKQVYQITESLTHLMEELDKCEQEHNESANEFYLRIENLTAKIREKIKNTPQHRSLIKGKLALIDENALRRFVNCSKPELSSVLRHQPFESLNEALSLAREEEAFLNKRKNNTNNKYNKKPENALQKFCKICKKNNHLTNQCRFRKPNYNNNNYNPQNPNYPNQSNYNSKKCTFCNFRGHTVDECRKKQFNQNLNPNPRVAHIDNNHLNLDSLGLTEAPFPSCSQSTSASHNMI